MDWWFVATHCELTLRNGKVFEGTAVHWYGPLSMLLLGVGAWFSAAGLLGIVCLGPAVRWTLACAVSFLIASVLWFTLL